MLSMIAAVSSNNKISDGKGIPWLGQMPDELRHFKGVTIGHTVVMGKNTYLEMAGPLKNRRNIVLSRKLQEVRDGFELVSESSTILDLAKKTEVFVIGGGKIYSLFKDDVEQIYLTVIDLVVPSGVDFISPDYSKWQPIWERYTKADQDNHYSAKYSLLRRASVSRS